MHPLLNAVAHRPFPPPSAPWIMFQSWRDLLFAHWPLEPELLRPIVPAQLPLQTFQGHAWLGIVPFRIRGLRPRAVPALPWLSHFAELNVRTYVSLEDTPGVYFFSLDAARLAAVLAARTFFRLPYFHAEMSVERTAGEVVYRSRRKRGDGAARFDARYSPAGASFNATPGTLDHWLVERYCLYSVGPRGRVYRVHIHHPPWTLQAAKADFQANTMTGVLGVRLPGVEPLLHFARRQDVLAWAPEPVRPSEAPSGEDRTD